MNIEIKRVKPDLDELYKIELLRHTVFHLKTDDAHVKTSNFIFHVMHNKMIPFTLEVDGELAAGIYVSCINDTLFINSLFVKEEYQNTKMQLGRKLLNSVLELIPIFEEHFGNKIKTIKLIAVKPKARSFYQKVGFTQEEKTPYMLKKVGF